MTEEKDGVWIVVYACVLQIRSQSIGSTRPPKVLDVLSYYFVAGPSFAFFLLLSTLCCRRTRK